MLYAVIARPPVLGGKVETLRRRRRDEGAGCRSRCSRSTARRRLRSSSRSAAWSSSRKDTWAAIKGRKALKIDWDDGANGSYDSAAYRAELELPSRSPGKVVRNDGDVYAAHGQRREDGCEADYYVPHFAHATMEPPAATARIVDGALRGLGAEPVAAGRARPGRQAAGSSDRPTSRSTSRCSAAASAASRRPTSSSRRRWLSRAMDGKPVKLTWTREDDLHHDYFHAVSAQHLEAGLDANGKVVAWLHRSAEPTIVSIFAPDPKHERRSKLGLGLVNVPYQIPNVRIENPEAPAHTRIGWLRVGEQHPARLRRPVVHRRDRQARGKDHRDYLLELIGPDRRIDPRTISDPWNHGESPERYPINTGRLRKVIETAAKEAGWGRKLPVGQGLGPRRALQLRHLHRRGGRSRRRRRGRARRFRASTSRSTADRRSTPIACARRSKAPA